MELGGGERELNPLIIKVIFSFSFFNPRGYPPQRKLGGEKERVKKIYLNSFLKLKSNIWSSWIQEFYDK